MKLTPDKLNELIFLKMTKNLAFDYNNLFNKAKLYVQRALEENREEQLFPFWLSLSLELLARATLAKVSAVLLADAGNNDSVNILYALGYESTKKPKSIMTSLVFDRLTKLNIGFTNEEQKISLSIVDQRNTELHSGLNGYDDFPVNRWLGDYYKIANILLKSQGLELKDFLGTQETKAATKMMEADKDKIKKVVLERIVSYKKVYIELSEEEKQIRNKLATIEVRKYKQACKIVNCPCCENNAILSGEVISFAEPKLEDGAIRQEIRYLPTQFVCFACGIKISGYTELTIVELGGQFSDTEYLDPLDYHSIDVNDYVNIDELVSKRLQEEHDYGMYGDD